MITNKYWKMSKRLTEQTECGIRYDDDDHETKEEFEENPCCRECGDAMFLEDGCEWPDNEDLWLCHSCIYDYAEKIKSERDEARNWAKSFQQAAHYWQRRAGQSTEPTALPWDNPTAND